MNRILGAVLIIASLALGYIGFNKISENSESVKFLGVKIEASDEEGKREGYLYVGLAVVLLGGGIYTLNKSKA